MEGSSGKNGTPLISVRMANSNHILSLARTKYPKSHRWQDAGIEIRSLLLFENPWRVPAICPSPPVAGGGLGNDRIKERKALVSPICSGLRWKRGVLVLSRGQDPHESVSRTPRHNERSSWWFWYEPFVSFVEMASLWGWEWIGKQALVWGSVECTEECLTKSFLIKWVWLLKPKNSTLG